MSHCPLINDKRHRYLISCSWQYFARWYTFCCKNYKYIGKVSISRYLMKSQKMKESTVFYLCRVNLEHLLYRFLNRTTTPDSCFSFRMADYVIVYEMKNMYVKKIHTEIRTPENDLFSISAFLTSLRYCNKCQVDLFRWSYGAQSSRRTYVCLSKKSTCLENFAK